MASTGLYGGKFFPVHKGHVDMAERAAREVDILYVIMWCDTAEQSKIDLNTDAPYCGILKNRAEYFTDMRHRAKQLHNALRHIPNIKIIIHDEGTFSDGRDWMERSIDIRERIGCYPDYVFCCDSDESWARGYPESKIINFYKSRESAPYKISGTELRYDCLRNWEYIPDVNKRYYAVRVLITGTESAGKTTLTGNLAEVFGGRYVLETGRDIWTKNCGVMTADDYNDILCAHYLAISGELAEITHEKFLFVDTDALVTLFYKYLYDYCASRRVEDIGDGAPVLTDFFRADELVFFREFRERCKFDVLMTLYPTCEWIQDGTRSHGGSELRQRLTRLINALDNTVSRHEEKIEISQADYNDRTCESIEKLKKLFKGFV